MKWIEREPKIKPNKNDSAIDKVQKIRGIKDIDRFLQPMEDELFNPFLMKHIESASNRIIKALKNDEKIVVSYDPDCDGLTSATIMVRYLRNYSDNIDFIYGERSFGHGIKAQTTLNFNTDAYEDRYNLNLENINKIKNADLLIIVDSSSNETEACKHIKEKFDTDIVIIDHHIIEQENPYAIIVNPQQEGCKYPNKHLSAAGVVFKVLQVMEYTLDSVDVWQYIDLVAIGIYADMMRLDILENRYLIMQGLRNIKNTGIIRILKGAKADLYNLNGDSIGFTIAPILNGTARMDCIKLAIDILLEDDDAKCKPLRLEMQKLNKKQKEAQNEISKQYMQYIDESKKVMIVADDNASRGFNGLICQQLARKFKRPVIVGRLHKGTLSGSFRSYGGFKFKEFLNETGLVDEAVGHSAAGGITIAEKMIPKLEQYIEEHMPSLDDMEENVIYDFEIDVTEIEEHINDIEKLNFITGNGFPKVIVKVNNITVEEVRVIGEKNETVKIKTFDDVELIKFRVDEHYANELSYFDRIDVVGDLSYNKWYNFKERRQIITQQIKAIDYRLSS